MIDKLIPGIQFILQAVGFPEKVAAITARMLPRITTMVSAMMDQGTDPETKLHEALDGIEAGWMEAERAKFQK